MMFIRKNESDFGTGMKALSAFPAKKLHPGRYDAADAASVPESVPYLGAERDSLLTAPWLWLE